MDEIPRTDRTTVRRLPARGSYDRAPDLFDPRRGADLSRGIHRRRAAVRDPHDPRAGRRSAVHARLARKPDAQGDGRRGRGLRHRDPGRRPGPGPVRVPPLDELPLGRRLRHGAGGGRPRGEGAGPGGAVAAPGRGPLARYPRARRPASSNRRPCSRCRSTRRRPRSAPALPLDDEEDYALPAWAGVVPLSLKAGEPVPCPRLAPGSSCRPYARSYPGRGIALGAIERPSGRPRWRNQRSIFDGPVSSGNTPRGARERRWVRERSPMGRRPGAHVGVAGGAADAADAAATIGMFVASP